MFIRYLREKAPAIIAVLLFAAIFAVTFILLHIPVSAVIYPSVLCAVIGGCRLVWDFIRIRKQHEQLQALLQLEWIDADRLPDDRGALAEDYRRIISLLCDKRSILDRDARARYTDMTEYYTVWAHQIKTPIAAMRLQLQNEDTALSRSLSADLNRIEQYVQMVLTFVRLDSESTDFVFRSISVDEVVRKALKRFSGEFIGRHLQLRYEPTEMKVVTDEKWLLFVLEQIISNALKYTPSGEIAVFTEDNTLCVRDTGIGINRDDLPRIFEKGYTGFNGRTDQKASGIGLYLCKRICDKLGVPIDIRSEAGVGTEVRLDFSRKCDENVGIAEEL